MKYEYGLLTWGGFYNKEYQDIHDLQKGYKYFETEKERQDYLDLLHAVESQLNAKYLMSHTFGGYSCREPVTLHRVTSFEGEDYYSCDELFPDTSVQVAEYHLKYKWYLGFNDYPLGEGFDYTQEGVVVKGEWISGNFNLPVEVM